jgi:hypothetical protein
MSRRQVQRPIHGLTRVAIPSPTLMSSDCGLAFGVLQASARHTAFFADVARDGFAVATMLGIFTALVWFGITLRREDRKPLHANALEKDVR